MVVHGRRSHQAPFGPMVMREGRHRARAGLQGPWPCPLMHASFWEKLNMFLDSLDIFVFWVGTLNIFAAFKGHMSTNCH